MKREIVYSFNDVVEYKMPQGIYLNASMKGITKNITGEDETNIVVDKKIVPNPKVSYHPNVDQLYDAHFRLHMGMHVPVTVNVYNDGSKEIVLR